MLTTFSLQCDKQENKPIQQNRNDSPKYPHSIIIITNGELLYFDALERITSNSHEFPIDIFSDFPQGHPWSCCLLHPSASKL